MTTLKNPIFIVGAPRSGTTLLQYMLRSHPNISLPTAESHFIIPLYRNREKFGDLGKEENIRRVLMFPSAQFIHLIRDGRDCALSMFERKHDFRVYNTFFAAKYWEIYVDGGRRMGRELGDKVYHEVRYEDLLDRSETTLQDLCSFLNEPYSDNILNFKKSGLAGKTPLLQKSLQTDNQAKWRSKMSPRQIATFEGAVGHTLTTLGYPLMTDAKPIPLPIKAFWRLHNIIITFLRNNFLPKKRKSPQKN